MTTYSLTRKQGPFHLSIHLASSKSESNRALILHALTHFKSTIENVSSARDTQTMIRLLSSEEQEANVIDAGTTMRFLTAYFALTNQKKTMTGTARMCERPIALLVNALRTIGAEIAYLGEDGFPPLAIQGFSEQKNDAIEIRGDVSSQYISALLMLAPTLPNGLRIRLLGEVGSVPYITMTIQQMAAFGVEVSWDKNENILSILPQKYTPITYQIESDWSGASYWYSILALDNHPESTVELIGLKANSLQGDSAIVAIMEQLGVKKLFHQVSQKPGKPLWFGQSESHTVFALPGNPASTLTCFNQYVKPCIDAWMGKTDIWKPIGSYPLADNFEKTTGLTFFLKAKLENGKVMILPGQESFNLISYGAANCIAEVGEEVESLEAGTIVKVYNW